MVIERRKHKRFGAEIKANYLVTGASGNVIEKGTATVENLSYIGAKLNLERSLYGKARFLIEFILEDPKTSVIAIGKMIWIRNNGNNTCGVAFDWVSDEQAYQKYVSFLQKADAMY